MSDPELTDTDGAAAAFDRTPESLFGRRELVELPKRELARHVGQLVDCSLALGDDPTAYQELLSRLDAVEGRISDASLDEEADLLRHVVDVVPLNGESLARLFPPLLAYASYLERQGCLDDALHVLALAVRTHEGELPPSQFVSSALHAARLNRELGRWHRAKLCYGMAERLGGELGDPVSALRGKLGCGAILRGRGRLHAAEAVARSVFADARRLSLTRLSVTALLDLSVTLGDQARYEDGLLVDRETLRLAGDDEDDRSRALCNIGVSLSDLGRYDDCRAALEEAVASAPTTTVRLNAQLELLKVDATLGDRIAFERRRRELESVRDRMSVIVLADFDYKLDIGYRRFGQLNRAWHALQEARGLAAKTGLENWGRRIECELRLHHGFQ